MKLEMSKPRGSGPRWGLRGRLQRAAPSQADPGLVLQGLRGHPDLISPGRGPKGRGRASASKGRLSGPSRLTASRAR